MARLQSEFLPERIFGGYEFSHEKCSEVFPENVEPLFCGSKKIPRNSRQISHEISVPKIKKNSPMSFCRGAGRTHSRQFGAPKGGGFDQGLVFKNYISGVLRRGEIGKGCDCNTCRGNPHLKHGWDVPSHELLQTNYCTRNSRNDAIIFRPLRTIASHELLHELLRQKTTIAVTPLAEPSPSPSTQIRLHLAVSVVLVGFLEILQLSGERQRGSAGGGRTF